MRRAARIGLVLVLVLGALLAINAIVLNHQTKSAEVTEPDGKLLEVGSVELQVVDHQPTGGGSPGEPIVLLHCFACSSRWWDSMVPMLNEDHRVVEIDLLGHGGSEKPSSGYEISSQSGAVADALSQIGVTQATVVGHALGGIVATSLAESASQLVDRVVVIGTPSESGEAKEPARARLAHTPVIGQALWRLRVDSLVKSGYGDAFAPGYDVGDGFESPDQVVADNKAMTYTSFTDANSAADDYLGEESIASRLTTTGVPVLAIDGTEDQILDPERIKEDYLAIPGARVELIEGAGHSPNVETPEQVAELVLDFAAEGVVTLEQKPGGGSAGEKRQQEKQGSPGSATRPTSSG